MAQDFSRSPPPQDPPGLFEYPDTRFAPQQAYQASYQPTYPAHQPSEAERTRPRAPSSAYEEGYLPDNRYYPVQQPIDDAVTSAFDKANPSSHIPPELISQITQNVIQQLKAASLDAQSPPNFPSQPQPQQGYHSQSGSNAPPPPIGSYSNHSGSPPPMVNRNEVYTPPSPHRSDEPFTGSPPTQIKYPPPPPSHQDIPMDMPAPSSNERRATSPLSQASEPGQRDTRPKGPPRISTGNEETTLEKIWGQLFDKDGNPTPRLSQFLRGLAIHLIEDYEPCHSLVITPAKMQKFYEDTKLPNEKYQWDLVFDDRTSSISRLYREVECQHHLVQEEHRFVERPDIPGLTPRGFEKWATLLIQAHPEAEYERLRKAVLDMPISNPDDKKERFPKEISRRLFPKGHDLQIRDRLERAMVEHCGLDIRKISSAEAPQSQALRPEQSFGSAASSSIPNIPPPPAGPPPMSNSIERERQPYSGAPAENPADATLPSQPIERERKPYSAQPGGGKHYDDNTKPMSAKLGRSESNASKTRPIPINPPNARPHDLPIPEPGHHRASSTVNPPSSARRHRSPSMTAGGTDFRRSEGDFFNNYGASPYGSSVLSGDSVDDEGRRYYREGTRDDGRGYDNARERARYERVNDPGTVPRQSYGNEDDYYRTGGRSGNGYDYTQPYPPSSYR